MWKTNIWMNLETYLSTLWLQKRKKPLIPIMKGEDISVISSPCIFQFANVVFLCISLLMVMSCLWCCLSTEVKEQRIPMPANDQEEYYLLHPDSYFWLSSWSVFWLWDINPCYRTQEKLPITWYSWGKALKEQQMQQGGQTCIEDKN